MLASMAAALVLVLVAAPPLDWLRAQTAAAVATEYGFVPSRLTFRVGVPNRLHLENRGKELHEFTAPALLQSVEIVNPGAMAMDRSEVVLLPRTQKDLYYRLNVFPFVVPPLRARGEAISLLVWTFAKQFGQALGKPVERIPQATMIALRHYPWPARGVRVGSDNEPPLPPPTARCTAPPAPVFPSQEPSRPEVSAPQPTLRRCFCLACWGRIGCVAPSWLRPAGTPAEHPAPSEIVESFRNLGRFPPSPPRSGYRRLPSNHLFSQGETRGEALEEGCGPVFASSIATRGVQGRQPGNSGSHMERRRSVLWPELR